jgi:hypothetical protein
MKKVKQYIALFGAVTFMAGLALQVIPMHKVSANQITARALTLQAGANTPFDGGSKPGGTVNHNFTFTLPNVASGNIGSMKFQYCTTAAAVPLGINCVAPSGINTTGVGLGNQIGATGWSGTDSRSEEDAPGTAKNEVVLSRLSPASITPGQQVTIRLDNVVNPSTAMTFFVRISTYASLDASGTAIDNGTVAAATSTQIHITGTMPESLVFCAGKNVELTNGVPDCSTVTTGEIAFDRLFSPTDTALATSQMAASTNAGAGYAITVNGSTLTSGSNQIAPMTTTTYSKRGIGQFGLNVVLNDATNTLDTSNNPGPNMTTMPTGYAPSANVAPATNNVDYNATPQTGYEKNGLFTFGNAGLVANSNNIGTNAQIYTASYIANVPGNQPAGTYSTTLTYICTATF